MSDAIEVSRFLSLYFSVICIKNLNKRIANQIISVQFYTIGLEVRISNNNGNKSLVYFVLKGLLFSSRDIEVLSYFLGVTMAESKGMR